MSADASLVKGGTILIPSGPADHLHFVCCAPVLYPQLAKECLLLVNISTIDPSLSHDPACILSPGDHPFINRPSYVYYRKADIFGCASIAQELIDGTFTTHASASDEIINRVLAGFSESREVRPKPLAFYNKYIA
ncbi:MAG: hypothetical protein DRQ56_06745 [Gammaproteobacteria bacterium]|nr:MAG: hypothetical protein DRQ56_06745 [Gammaproteobacteria bacterium]